MSTPIHKGWNLIGSLHVPVATSAVISQPDSILGVFYQFTGDGYTMADTIRPGRAYWVKAIEGGTLTLINSAWMDGDLP